MAAHCQNRAYCETYVHHQDGKLATPRLSRDNGRSWDSSIIKAPEAVVSGSLSVVMTADNYIILYCGGSGEVWKGRINRLGWK